jgi:hypothetical protein
MDQRVTADLVQIRLGLEAVHGFVVVDRGNQKIVLVVVGHGNQKIDHD